MAQHNVITKIYRLEDKESQIWNMRDIGAEASNVYVRNGNGHTKTAQSLLLSQMPPTTYKYGQDICDVNRKVFEPLTWNNIQKWLNEGRINDFLKEGDCIEVTTDIVTTPPGVAPEYLKWHFYIIGIDRHNGQSREALSQELSHIDFCGGSMTALSRRFHNVNSLPSTNFNFADAPSNNGGIANNDKYYGNYFIDSDLFTATVNKTIDKALAEVCNQDTIPFADKVLYLDARFLPRMNVLFQIFAVTVDGSVDIAATTEKVNAFLINLAQFWENSFPDEEASNLDFVSTYKKVSTYWHSEDFQIFKSILNTMVTAQLFLQYSIGQIDDDFLTEMVKESQNKILIDSDFALSWARLTVDLIKIPNPIESTFDQDIEKIINNASGNDNYSRIQNILMTLYWMARYAHKRLLNSEEGTKFYYSINSEKADRYAERTVWGLTEKEIFGECTFSKPEYAQGQIFQYPIFNNMVYRQKITSDLLKTRDGDTVNPCMVTMTPVESSNTNVVGMDIDTLMPKSSSILNSSSYLPDMPICFRIQQEQEET